MKPIILSILLILFILPLTGEDLSYMVGAFDPPMWHGVVMVKGSDVFAFRFIIHQGDQKADGYDTFYLAERVGPITKDGGYSEVAFNTTLPFGKKGETPILEKKAGNDMLLVIRYARTANGIIGTLAIPDDIQIEIIFYHPWHQGPNYQCKDNIIAASGKHSFVFTTDHITSHELKEGQLSCMVAGGVRQLPFYAGFEAPGPNTLSHIPTQLAQLREKELAAQPYVEGEWRGLLGAISHNLLWMRLYQPDNKRPYLPAGRRWIFPGPDGKRDLWTVFEWDAFFNALETVLFDPALARSEIKVVLDSQYPWGNIPNWRSANNGSPDRSQPPVGTLAVMKCYLWTQDRSILTNAYEGLKRWHRFWKNPGINGTPRRDGNRDGLLEWGSDRDKVAKNAPPWEVKATGRQRAAWESGQDDLPNFDNIPFAEAEGTLKMNCLDLNALYALDAQLLARMAKILNKRKDFVTFHREYKKMKRLINRNMWKGDFYYDRLWDGRFSTHKAASNFYPLLAGIPEPEQAEKMVRTLKNPTEFWGEYIIPTISRDNPAYKDQQYWRGTIWPPTNYLVYQGLKRYGMDELAASFARKSARLFLNSWQKYALCRENYNSMTGAGGGQRYQSWGPLFALILVEDFIDISPFDGLRVGNLAASAKSTFHNLPWGSDRITLLADKNKMQLRISGKPVVEARGRGVLRNLDITKISISFTAHVTSEEMSIYPRLFGRSKFIIIPANTKMEKHPRYIRLTKGTHPVLLRRQR